MPARFVIFKDSRRQYRFRLVAPNNKIIAVSESYNSKAGCINGIKSVRRNAPRAEVVDLTE